MNSKNRGKIVVFLSIIILYLSLPAWVSGYEIFIYRPYKEKEALSWQSKIVPHGDFFVQLQNPSTFPSYNDLSGEPDRWNFGFRNIIFLTDSTKFLAQLVVHDDSRKRTKFDWHFSLRQSLFDNLVLIFGHDSDHDSDHVSLDNDKPFYTNRNYVGFGLPIQAANFYIEPFTWFFHHTNQRVHLDLSGNKLHQELGLRLGAIVAEKVTLSFQIFSQTEHYFYLGQAYWMDFIIRMPLRNWLELSLGTSLWKDLETSPLGNRQKFYKFMWGLALPF
jgi:hypothetical protein